MKFKQWDNFKKVIGNLKLMLEILFKETIHLMKEILTF